MTDMTPRIGAPLLTAAQAQKHITHNDALIQMDAVIDLCLLGRSIDTPPSSPADGDAYLVGGAPTGLWSGQAHKIACCVDAAWRFYTPFNGLRAYVVPANTFIVYLNGVWTDWNSLISASEVSAASAATCDLGAAGSLFVEITGTTAIASFGMAANRLRFVRFADALTLTHNATSLVLLGHASRTTAAGDTGIYASDASGNWREINYARAAGVASGGAQPFGAYDLNGTNQTSIVANGYSKVLLSHAASDSIGGFDSANHKIVPTSPGLYLVSGIVTIALASALSDSPQAIIYLNGARRIIGNYLGGIGGGTGTVAQVSGLVRVNGTTDYLEFYCFTPSGIAYFWGDSSLTYLQLVKISD
jgi:hypothetical protein